MGLSSGLRAGVARPAFKTHTKTFKKTITSRTQTYRLGLYARTAYGKVSVSFSWSVFSPHFYKKHTIPHVVTAVAWSVSLCVSVDDERELLQSGLTDRDVVWHMETRRTMH